MGKEFSPVQQMGMEKAEAVVLKFESHNQVPDSERMEIWADGVCVFVIESITGQIEAFRSILEEIKLS